MFEIISLIANLVLSGGLIVTLVTIKSVRKKGNIAASQADMEQSKSYVDEFTKNIVEPMKDKVNDLERVASGLKREMARLRKAINKANSCQWLDSGRIIHPPTHTIKFPPRAAFVHFCPAYHTPPYHFRFT